MIFVRLVSDLYKGSSFLSTAWDLANLYLTSIGAPCLSEEAIQLEGLSNELYPCNIEA